MKNIYISLEDRDKILDNLFDYCEQENAYFSVNPIKDTIEVFDNKDNHCIATMNIINITDVYDLYDELFN